MPLQPGTTLGPYEVLSAIGAGGMGEVYRARDTKLDLDVAPLFPSCMAICVSMLVLAWSALNPVHAQQYTPFEDTLSRFDARIAEQVQQDGIGGMSAGVIVDGRLAWKRAWGWADVARQVPADPDGVYRIGSVTKVFTGMLLMHLVEQGVVDLDEPVDPYVPELNQLRQREPDRPITFRQLASHSAGLPPFPDVADPFVPVDDDRWDTLLLEFIPQTTVLGPPGGLARYSNMMGYGVLGLALQRAAGRSFLQLMDETILAPLQLDSTGYRLTPRMRERLATGYQNYSDGRLDPDRALRHQDRLGASVPSALLYSTVEDLGRVLGLLMRPPANGRPRILTSASLREIVTVQAESRRRRRGYVDRGYGFGFLMMEHPSGLVYAVKDGYDSGYLSLVCFDPTSRLGVILLRNYNEGSTFLPIAAADLLVPPVPIIGETTSLLRLR